MIHFLLLNLATPAISLFPISEPSGSKISHNINPFWISKQTEIPQLMLDCHDINTAISAAIQSNSPIETV